MTQVSSGLSRPTYLTTPTGGSLKPLFKPEETPTVQDSVFFRRGDNVGENDWACHMDRFKRIDDPSNPDFMPRAQGLLAAAAGMGAGVATSLATAPYALTVAGPLLVGSALWATGSSDKGLLSTIGEQFSLPLSGASKVADTVFEKVAGSFYEGDGPTLSLHQDQSGLIWGIPKEAVG